MGPHLQQPPQVQPVKRRWMLASCVVTIVSLNLLLWTLGTHTDVDFWTRLSEAPAEASRFPQRCGPGQTAPPHQKVSLTLVNGTHTRLVSAYREHRRGSTEVRVIAIVLRSEEPDYRCLLCCQDQLRISRGAANVHSNHFWFAYGTAHITCPLPPGCEAASHVALVSSSALYEDLLLDYVEVKNQEVRNHSFPFDFTVCISTMFEFTNVLQMVQSLEMLQLLGVDRVVIYKSSCNADTQRVLDYYVHKGLVELVSWPLSRLMNVSRSWLPSYSPGDIHYFGQIPALNDCVYRYMYQSRYVALHDLDELILPQTVDSWTALLPLLEDEYGADKCYRFENNVFPNTVRNPPPSPPGSPPGSPAPVASWHGVPGVDILAHLHHEPVNRKLRHYGVKYIVNPRVVVAPTVHNLLSSQNGCSMVDSAVGRMYHTRSPKTKIPPEQLIFDGRLLSYSRRLVPAVTAVLRECGIISTDGSK
ncbi:uncharacterized protein LOC114868445 [Betta splendens]|uniref:Glycosyltransferase family 92 protein n=1 Tax=Betta splendens TaxID=158456 RepID=A0A6P7P5W3_BETSP|nr:uncharacterized protein LOC114868445 [Betta splendens]